MRRVLLLLLLGVVGAGGAAGSASSSLLGGAARRSRGLLSDREARRVERRAGNGHGVWRRAAVTLVAGNQHTSAPQLALFGVDEMIAAWLQGPSPRVYLGSVHGASAAPTARVATAKVQRLVVDLGTLAGGFGLPQVLSSGPSGSYGAPLVAGAGAVAFVAWDESPGPDVRLAVLRKGEVVLPGSVVLRDAVPVALHGVRGGRAVIVWDQYGHGFPLLQVALVNAAGRLGKRVTIAHTNGQDAAVTPISINDHGDLLAAWARGEAINERGRSATGTVRVFVSVCEPALRCTAPRAIALGRTRPACVSPAVAITPNGSAIVVAAAHGPGPDGCTKPLGVWDAAGAPGQRLGMPWV